MNNVELFNQFANDIIYDVHSAITAINRSASAGKIQKIPPSLLFPELNVYLNNHSMLHKDKEFDADVKLAWCYVLEKYAEIWKITTIPATYQFPLWKKWVEENSKTNFAVSQ